MNKYYIYKLSNKDSLTVNEEQHKVIQTILDAGAHQMVSVDGSDKGIYTGNIKSWSIDHEYARLRELEGKPRIEAPQQGETPFQQAFRQVNNALDAVGANLVDLQTDLNRELIQTFGHEAEASRQNLRDDGERTREILEEIRRELRDLREAG